MPLQKTDKPLRAIWPLLLVLSLLANLAGCIPEKKYPPLATATRVDVNRYLGRWYEIARIDHSFQKDCVAAAAEYSLRPDGDIRVVNSCRIKTPDGPLRSVEGRAWVVDKDTNAWLEVQFFWPFRGDYVVIDLDERNYGYAVVGHPSRDYLWVLSRTPQLEAGTYGEILERIAKQGYDLNRIKKYPQVMSK